MPTAPAAPRSRAARQAFITGASGFIGWHLATRLRDNGWSGWAIEEIDNSFDPIGELKQGLAYFRNELEPILDQPGLDQR